MTLVEGIGAETEPIVLEDRLREANHLLSQAFRRNEKLLSALSEAREQIGMLRDELDRLSAPPSTFGVYLSANPDTTVNILSQGRKLKVTHHPSAAEHLREFRDLTKSPRVADQVDAALRLMRAQRPLSAESRHFIATSLESAMKSHQELHDARWTYAQWPYYRYPFSNDPFAWSWRW